MLKVEDVWKSYEGAPLLKGVSFRVQPGETICLLGPSGSGKSTLLRLIAGLEELEGGRILFEGQDLAGVPVHHRNFGLMFQDYALFPHQNVAQNVAFGLRMQGVAPRQVQARVAEMLARVNLTAFAERRVAELSGGEQQRVALARALAPGPRLLMLDEPLAALDRTLREQLSQELRRILHQTGIPAIYVTHDQEEAFAIADRLVVLHDGELAQEGIPDQIYTYPASAWVARFFGLGNLVQGQVNALSPLRVHTHLGDFEPCCAQQPPQIGQSVDLLLRPQGARVRSHKNPIINQVHGIVADCAFGGEMYRITLRVPGGDELFFLLPQAPPVGSELILQLAEGAIVCLP
jgi:spermidine/putrescine transport system ATP-binding protein